jgi:hypothetical protein
MPSNENSEGLDDGSADPFASARSLTNELAEIAPPSNDTEARVYRTNPQDPEHIAALDAYRTENPPDYETTYQASILAKIDRLSQIPGKERALKRSRERLRTGRFFLSISLQYGSQRFIRGFLEEVNQSGVATLEVPVLGQTDADSAEGGAVRDTLAGLAVDALAALSNEQYETLLRAHTEVIRTAIESRQPEMEALQESFLVRLEERVEAGIIPITIEEARNRLALAKPQLIDPWELNHSGSRIGDYDYASGNLRLDASLPPDVLATTYDHEAFHILAGKTVKSSFNQDEDSDIVMSVGPEIAPNITHNERDEVVHRKRRFEWLNEALTEQLSMDLRGGETGTYSELRRILDLLNTHIPRSYFYAAYFEDFKPGEGTPAWGELQRQLNNNIERRILLTLDKMIAEADIEEDGLDSAYEYLTNALGASPTAQ